MKVFVLAVLLVSICCLEGALVKRETESQAPALTEAFQQYTQLLSQYFPPGLFSEEKLEQLRSHAQSFAQQAQEHLKPLTDQVRDSFTQVLTSLQESFKKATSP